MKRQPSKQESEKTNGANSPSVVVKRIADKSKILSYLERERTYSASAIAHLEPSLADVSEWMIATHMDDFALCLISKSTSPTYVFTLGKASMLDSLLSSMRLPSNAFITCQPQNLNIIEKYYEISQRLVLKRMVVTRDNFKPTPEDATRLRSGHIKELNGLYKSHGNSVFFADQIRRGVYYGIWRDGQLAAAAGTHIISPTHGIAYVGNVLTHSSYRNQGLATTCTSAVTEDLFDYCTEVVLNVEPNNVPAIRAYASLGYKDDCMIIEAFGRRQRLVGSIITNLLRKFRMDAKHQEGVKADGGLQSEGYFPGRLGEKRNPDRGTRDARLDGPSR
ncbi:MAG: GNAT family N-acetyltransferase [Dehalococcoidia bacterium]|nr:GNAT family N-acetyltransferase [Dehalococcoidia bacterium]